MAANERDRGELMLERTSQLIIISDEFIDPYGDIVNHAAFPMLFERDRNGIMLGRKTSFERIFKQHSLIPVAGSLHIEFKRPLKSGDELTINTQAYLLDKKTLTFYQEMMRGNKLTTTSEVISYFMGLNGRVATLPDSLIRQLSVPEDRLPENLRGIQGIETFPFNNYFKSHKS